MKNHLRVVWGAFALLVVLFIAAPTFAQDKTGKSTVFKHEDRNGYPMALRLYQSPCLDDKVMGRLIRMVKPDMIEKFQTAVLTWQGKEYASCWIEILQDKEDPRSGLIFSVDETGETLQPIPASEFVDDTI